MVSDALPARLEAIAQEFEAAPDELRIELLLDYAARLPQLPPHLDGHPEAMEQVVECQTPFFLVAEVGSEGEMRLWFDCPPQAPTTRAFAGILAEGLRDASPQEVLAVPDDLAERMGLGGTISPLRLRGMVAILRRMKRQIRARVAEDFDSLRPG